MMQGWVLALLACVYSASGQITTPEVASRTHTFQQYAANSVFQPLVPVYVSEPDVQSYPDGNIVDLQGNALTCDTTTSCIVVNVYKSPWKQNSWTRLSPDIANRAFTFRSSKTIGTINRLVIDLSALSAYYTDLYATGQVNYYYPPKAGPRDAQIPANGSSDILPFSAAVTEQEADALLRLQPVVNEQTMMAEEARERVNDQYKLTVLKACERVADNVTNISSVPDTVRGLPFEAIDYFYELAPGTIPPGPGRGPNRILLHGTAQPRMDADTAFDPAICEFPTPPPPPTPAPTPSPTYRPTHGKKKKHCKKRRKHSDDDDDYYYHDDDGYHYDEGDLYKKRNKRKNKESTHNTKGKDYGNDERHVAERPLHISPRGPTDKRDLNYVQSDYTFDYAVVFRAPTTTSTTLYRLDITIVPRVKRTRPTSLLCGSGSVTLDMVQPYMPTQISAATVSQKTNRAAPYAISSTDFATLHPEEAAWVAARLLKTAPALQSFASVHSQTISPAAAQLKIAVAHSGGGKRAMINSFGVSSALYNLGIYDHATWTAGLSGGGWHVASWYGAMANQAVIQDPATTFTGVQTPVQYAVFGDQVNGNELLTNFLLYQNPFFNSALNGVDAETDLIMCEGSLKLQEPFISNQKSAATVEHWSRALASQLLPSDKGLNRGTGVTVSSLAADPLLANHNAALPVWQIQENLGTGDDPYNYRLWDFTPFDMTVNKGTTIASFPTSLLGSVPSQGQYVSNLDELSYIYGLSSYAFAGFQGGLSGAFASFLCGFGSKQICQGTPVANPFKGFSGVIGDELYTKDNVVMVDGGINHNIPIAPFVDPGRQADVLYAVDSSAGESVCPGGAGPYSADTPYPQVSSGFLRTSYACTADNVCPEGYYSSLTTSSTCCDLCYCLNAENFATGCWPDATASNNALFAMIRYNTIAATSLPTLPAIDGEFTSLVRKVSFFGCKEVATKTAIVYIPNRITVSGMAGFNTLKGSANVKVAVESNQDLTANNVQGAFKNGQSQLPNTFAQCVACLYAAKAAKNNAYMSNNCASCYAQYCFS